MIYSNAKLVLQLAALVALLVLLALILSIVPTQAGPSFISESHAYVGSVGDDWIGEERLVATGTVIIEKVTFPAGGTGFQFTNNIGPSPFNLNDGQKKTFKDVDVGTYSVIESDPTVIPGGYRLVHVACVETGTDNSFGTVGTRTATINLETGETVTCTFFNGRRGTIIVDKQTDPDGAAGSFTFTGDAAGTISDGQQIVVSDLAPGTYHATEYDPAPGFDLTAITCDDDNSSGDVGTGIATFQLETDETVTCTFTNTQWSTIIVEKQTDPDGAPDLFTFIGDANGTISDGQQIVVGGLPTGTYTSQEVVQPGWRLSSIVCDDDNSSGDVRTGTATFQLEAGETVKCTFTNNEEVVVGGIVVPVNKLELLAPWMGLVALLAALAAGAAFVNRTDPPERLM